MSTLYRLLALPFIGLYLALLIVAIIVATLVLGCAKAAQWARDLTRSVFHGEQGEKP